MKKALQIRVRVKGASYAARVQPGLISRVGRELRKLKHNRICIITNDRVWDHWGDALTSGLKGFEHSVIRIPDGEEHKNLGTVERISEELLRAKADRGCLLLGLGGGVIGDVTGFVAGVYQRGVACVHVPTTLLAMVDSCLGGKTGVNLRGGKNMVGVFHHPKMVFIDPEVLKTLPERELRAGMFEVIKCGIIRSRPLFDFLERNRAALMDQDPAALTRVIRESLLIKARVVSEDEREDGLRRILNFGHTIGHTLESETRYSYFLHGEAVAWGMRGATFIAERLNMISGAAAARIHSLTMAYGPLPPLDGLKAASLIYRLPSDKKTRNGVVHFVLPQQIGRVRIVPGVRAAVLEKALEALLA